MTPAQSGEYLAREVERAKKFFAFAKSTLIPHSTQLAQKMRDPDGLIKEGRQMVENAPGSWQGYDYMGSGHMMKRDLDVALENFDKALAAAPDMQKDWYRYMMATCYNAKKDSAKALALYDRIIAANDNWIAVKNSYIRASMMLIGRDNGKAADYFDKGMLLASRAERDAFYAAGVCGKFQGAEKGPEACSADGKL
jgi:tetratricopeptide (TPR) repeat protein